MARARSTTPSDSDPRKGASRRLRGFEPAAALVATQVRAGAESRGFAVTRLLTHWTEIVGADTAAHTRPVKIAHGKGMGATLTILTDGAHAPLVQMELPRIRDRVNACYGFNAVARITVTQTAPQGFAEGQAQFRPVPAPRAAPPSPGHLARAEAMAAGFTDPQLAEAMRQLALNILSRRDATDRKALK
ncbi:MAG TPA: DUF721 domain-containing protein [Paracoccus sp. (in: a-proteobacteria)]|nr:DUF721 domain-containing protein [Paracoccus sp. (in: a-proteobacteria)]